MLSPEVANLIDFIWNEATGSLSDILAVPADSIKLEDIEKAEAVLLLLKKSLDSAEDSIVLKKLSDEFFSIIPHKNTGRAISSKYLIAQKQDLCQVRAGASSHQGNVLFQITAVFVDSTTYFSALQSGLVIKANDQIGDSS